MAYAQKTLDQLRFGLNSLTFKASRIYQMLKPLVVKVEDALAPKVEVSLYDDPKSTYEDLNHVSLQLQPGDLALLHTLSAHEITTLLHSGHMAELPFKGYFSNRQKGIDFCGIHYHQRQVFMAYDMAGELELANLVYPAALTEIPGPVMKAHSELLKNCLHPSSTGIILKKLDLARLRQEIRDYHDWLASLTAQPAALQWDHKHWLQTTKSTCFTGLSYDGNPIDSYTRVIRVHPHPADFDPFGALQKYVWIGKDAPYGTPYRANQFPLKELNILLEKHHLDVAKEQVPTWDFHGEWGNEAELTWSSAPDAKVTYHPDGVKPDFKDDDLYVEKMNIKYVTALPSIPALLDVDDDTLPFGIT